MQWLGWDTRGGFGLGGYREGVEVFVEGEEEGCFEKAAGAVGSERESLVCG